MNPSVSVVVTVMIVLVSTTKASADPINLLVNPGFETGDFSGWIVGGTSSQIGVARDGVAIANADALFQPNFQNVRSGLFAGNALVHTSTPDFKSDVERITLKQTIAVEPGQKINAGFWLGNDSASGANIQIFESLTQIFVDGGELLPFFSFGLDPGSGPRDFVFLGSSFNTKARTTVDIEFAITASNFSRLGVSFDDFFVSPEPVPEPSSMLLLATGCVAALARRRHSKSLG
jgi:hypothetical protein